jgi:RHS repeat-associated protein
VSDAVTDLTKGFSDGNTVGNDYDYDVNGNMVYDKNKSITAANAIQYNHLNLPQVVTKSTNENIKYTYDASGRKLMQKVYNASNQIQKTTEYDGEFIYQNDVLQFINHEEGRIVMTGATPEYQFHLKDHLGNVRMTITTVPGLTNITATFEASAQANEATQFLNYPTGSHLSGVIGNAHTGTYSEYLNGAASGQVGVAKSFSVMPGDVVELKAYAKYGSLSGTNSNLAGFATALLNAFTLPAPGNGETGTPSSAINAWGAQAAGGFGDGSSDQTDPRVFATIIIFDRNYNYVDVAYQQLTSSGVMNPQYTVKQPGYAYLYISNEEAKLRDVYFDDVMMKVTQSPVVQTDDYYPFGLTFNSYSRENSVPNNYKYNGKELQTDLGLNWEDYGARMYMPEIGRWGVSDPKSETFYSWSPLNYVFNNPMNFVDPDGRTGVAT